MKVDYKYYLLPNKSNKPEYTFNEMNIHEINEVFDDYDSLNIIKKNGLYEATAIKIETNSNNTVSYSYTNKYYIPEVYFKEATLLELLPHNKPIILTKDSKCEYIEQVNKSEFNFIFESNGNIIRMNFDGDSILAYFKDINIIYVYSDREKDKNSSIKTSIYSNFTEKHVIMDGFGIFSEYNNQSREATFVPLRKDLTALNFSEFNTAVINKYDILPYYLRTYFVCTDIEGKNATLNTLDSTRTTMKQKLYPNMLLPNKTNSEFILEEEITNQMTSYRPEFKSVILSTEIIV